MAQIITDVENEMFTEKALHTELDALNSESNTAIYRLWMYVTAAIIVFFEEVMDLFKSDVQAIIDNNQYGTDDWWKKKILAFQYGDLLVFLNNIFQYAVIDPTLQIVQYCSITSVNGVVQIKAATSVAGQPGVLGTDQLAGLVSYCSKVQPSGIRFAVLSLAADLVKLYGNIYFDAAADIAIVQPAVELAITNFLAVNDPVNFNGTLYVQKLVDAIQAVPGVVGPQVDILSIAAKNGGSDYTTFTSSYQPESGYFMIDPAFPLSATLTYLPFVA